jgi:hypothetical protein
MAGVAIPRMTVCSSCPCPPSRGGGLFNCTDAVFKHARDRIAITSKTTKRDRRYVSLGDVQ